MWFLKNKITIAVHSGNFHADEVFAVAVLDLFINNPIKIIRTRDALKYSKADYLLDIGRVYDPNRQMFDHHQEGGAGKRDNGIPYATFGLVWKEYGEKICDSTDIALNIDKRLVQTIDADDNGFEVCEKNNFGFEPYLISDFISILNPTWMEKKVNKKVFFDQAVKLAKHILRVEIKKNRDFFEGKQKVISLYKEASDKRIIILDDDYDWKSVLEDFPEPLFAIRNVADSGTWNISCVKVKGEKFKNRLDFPLAWAGKEGEELIKITGIEDALFCHNNCFMASAKSLSGAVKLVRLALGEDIN
jgi:uncharacterized UPF0160 family protein